MRLIDLADFAALEQARVVVHRARRFKALAALTIRFRALRN
jgi:hypothetical protein